VAVFDLDGTLVDSSRDIHDALDVALRTVDDGRESTAADEAALHRGAHGQTLEQFFTAARPALSDDGLRALIAVYRKRYYDHLLDHTRPFEGVVDGLERLRRLREESARSAPDGPRLRLCIATTKLTATARRVTEGLGLYGYFDQVLGSDGLRAKPDPAVVHAVFSRLGRAPGLVADRQWDVMVGDTDFDVLAGRAAGLSTCAVGWSELPRERLLASRPDFVARTFTEVVELIVAHTLHLW
jgi:phosphoglycolate phosphatase